MLFDDTITEPSEQDSNELGRADVINNKIVLELNILFRMADYTSFTSTMNSTYFTNKYKTGTTMGRDKNKNNLGYRYLTVKS